MSTASDPEGVRTPCHTAGVEFEFGECRLSLRDRQLVQGGAPVAVQPKVMDLLLYLVTHRDRLVSAKALHEALWPDTQVGPGSLLRLVKEARRAIGDDGRRQTYIKTVHKQGYRFVAPVVERSGGERVYLGRRPLLSGVEAALEAAARGQGRVMLLEGAPGIGKTSTLLEAAERARLMSVRVIEAWMSEAASPGFSPWRRVLRELDAEELAVAARLSPELARWIRGDAEETPRPRLDAGGEQFRLFDQVGRLLADITRQRPAVLLFDDLHNTDAASLSLLEFLTPLVTRTPLSIIGTIRPAEFEQHPRRMRPLVRLASHSSVETWSITGLDEADLRQLVELRTELPDPGALTRLLLERTRGNPFFAEEILRYLVGSGRLRSDTDLEALIPTGVQAIMERRLNAVSDRTERFLRAAAAVAHEWDVELLAKVVPEIDPGDALEEADAARLVVRTQRAPARYRFIHPLIREALDSLSPPGETRQRLHLRIAQELERTPRPDPAEQAELLAYHLLHALPVAPTDAVVAALVAAARSAAQVHAFGQASQHYERAIELLGQIGRSGDIERCELLMELGAVRLGELGRDAARRSFAQAGDLARRLDLAEPLARAALGFAYRRTASGSADDRVVARLEEALERLPEDPVRLRSQLQTRLGVELLYREPRARGEALITEGVRGARALGDPQTLASALECQTYAMWSPRNTREWIALNAEIQQLAQRAEDMDLSFRGLKSRATGWLELGDRETVDQLIGECERFTDRHPLTYARWITAGMRAMTALAEGRLEDAERWIGRSREEGRQDETSGLAVVAQTFQLRRLLGELDRVEDTLAFAARSMPALTAVRAALGHVYLAAERSLDARGELEVVVREQLPTMPYDRNRFFGLCLAAQLCEGLSSEAEAELLLEALEPFEELHVVVGSCALHYGAVAHHVGLLQSTLGQWAEAEASFDRAARAHTEMQASAWVAETRYAQARLSLRRADDGDSGRARRRAAEAFELAESLGMRGIARSLRSAVRGRS
jgi:DNA-binding winged helix-turn-helix (wHTH) protein/tetratricopeptide (TPR) repeat protein